MKNFFVYIMTNKKNGTLYVGVTSNLTKRAWEHKEGITGGFTSKYNLRMLVYYEHLDNAEHAIMREKKLKKWPRQWKLNLISEFNPDWNDLYPNLTAT